MFELLALILYYAFCLALFVISVHWLLEKIPVGGNKSKPVLITGCDHGFGELLTLRLLRNGFPVYAGCLTQHGIDELNEKAKLLPGKLDAFLIDITSDESVQRAKEHVEQSTSVLWAIVHNAGIMPSFGVAELLTVADYQRCLDVNFLGMVRVQNAFTNHVKRMQGRIVAVTSVAGRIPLIYYSHYVASKFAAQGYLKTLMHELSPFNVTVHVLEPAGFKTPLLNKERQTEVFLKGYNSAPEETRAFYGDQFRDSLVEFFSDQVDHQSSCISWVIDCYYSAITSRFPLTRYRPGIESSLIYFPLSILPDVVTKWAYAAGMRAGVFKYYQLPARAVKGHE